MRRLSYHPYFSSIARRSGVPGTVTTRTWLCSTCFSAREGCAGRLPAPASGVRIKSLRIQLAKIPHVRQRVCRLRPLAGTVARNQRRLRAEGVDDLRHVAAEGDNSLRRGDGNQRQGAEQGKPVFMRPALLASGRQSGDATGSAQARLRYAAHRAGRSECHPPQTAPCW